MNKNTTHSSNIFICVPENKGTRSSLEQQEEELMMTDLLGEISIF